MTRHPELDAASSALDAAARRLDRRLRDLAAIADWYRGDRQVCFVCLMPLDECPGHKTPREGNAS